MGLYEQVSTRALTCVLMAGLVSTMVACGTSEDSAEETEGTASTLGTVSVVMSGNREIYQNANVVIPALEETIPAEGRVEFDVKSWDELGLQGPEVLRLASQGQVNIVDASYSIVAGDVPILEVADLPGLNPTIEQMREVSDATEEAFNEGLESMGLVRVMTNSNPMQVMYCSSPVSSVADISGKSVRVSGAAMGEMIESFGGQAVSLAGSETYSALERSTVDCAITGTGTGNALKWPEVSSYLYTLPISWSAGGYFANKEWWDGLAEDDQAYMSEKLGELEDDYWAFIDELTQDGINCNTGQGECVFGEVPDEPMTLSEPSADDLSQLADVLSEVLLPDWISRCGDECGEVYADVIEPISGITAS